MKNKLLLSELNYQIRDVLIEAFPETVWVVAEISEMKENRSGHCYLELIEKDELTDEILARARATIWSYTFRMLKPYFETTTGQTFSSGIKVLVQASVEFHPAFGLSLNIKDIDPTYTLGDMARRRNEIINRLREEGVFDMNKELPLPEVPQKIAIISSSTAAGYLDFINQLENNVYNFRFYPKLFEATMQGAEAVPSVIRALERIFVYEDFFDAVVIIRGGGAQADLSCFDNYELALNVAQFPLPVLTGIGHEKDDTIVDLVAHTRLKTPTAVAEFLISGVHIFYEKLNGLESDILGRARDILDFETRHLERLGSDFVKAGKIFTLSKKSGIEGLSHKLNTVVGRYTNKKIKQLNLYGNSASGNVRLFLNLSENKLKQYSYGVRKQTEFVILNRKNTIKNMTGNLKSSAVNFIHTLNSDIFLKEKSVYLLNPENVLRRGYTLTYKDGKLVKSKCGLNEGDRLTTRFTDGDVQSKIEKKQL